MTTNSFSFEKGEINITENGEDIILSKPVTVCWSHFYAVLTVSGV